MHGVMQFGASSESLDASASHPFLWSCCARPHLCSYICCLVGPFGLCTLEVCCSTTQASATCAWRELLTSLGYGSELSVEVDVCEAGAKRVVLREAARRASFPRRLRLALERLGLKLNGGAVSETDLRVLQYHHGFVLDRRYHRHIRESAAAAELCEPAVEAEAFRFYPDTLPGARQPSRLSARCLAQHGRPALTAGPPKPRSPSPDGQARPAPEELAEGRDLELCAFAPVASSPQWSHIWSPVEGALQPCEFYEYGIVDGGAPSRLSYPLRAHFGWQMRERPQPVAAFHRMAMYTCPHKGPRAALRRESEYLGKCYELHSTRSMPNATFSDYLLQFGLRDGGVA